MTRTSSPAAPEGERHRLHEDVVALAVGTLLVSLGVVLYGKATLLVGSSAGFALLLQYATGWSFPVVFSVVNVPFYILAIVRMGWLFTARTFVAVTLVSLLTRLPPGWIEIGALQPAYAAVIGGSLIGIGMLLLFRHRTGLGGINILAIYLQEKIGLSAGLFQMGFDAAIFVAAAFVIPLDRLPLSILGAAIMNLILYLNHRPGRYFGYS